jgi:Cysteine-rich secretory protein family
VPLPRPRPPLRDTARENPVALISAFRQQHGEGPVAISPALTRIAQEQANAMATRDLLDRDVLAPFSSRMSRSRFNRAAENIAFGHADFAGTLKQWTNSSGHRANLLLRGAKGIGVAHAQNNRRMYWAMVIAVGVNSSNDPKRRNMDGCAGVATVYCVNRRSGPRIKKSAPACSGHPERDDNRVRGADDGKGKLLSPVGDKTQVNFFSLLWARGELQRGTA